METTTATATPAVESPETRIMRALGRMPFLPMASYYSTNPEPEILARTLECFADALAEHAKRDNERDERLRILEHDLAAVRRVFGVTAE